MDQVEAGRLQSLASDTSIRCERHLRQIFWRMQCSQRLVLITLPSCCPVVARVPFRSCPCLGAVQRCIKSAVRGQMTMTDTRRTPRRAGRSKWTDTVFGSHSFTSYSYVPTRVVSHGDELDRGFRAPFPDSRSVWTTSRTSEVESIACKQSQ